MKFLRHRQAGLELQRVTKRLRVVRFDDALLPAAVTRERPRHPFAAAVVIATVIYGAAVALLGRCTP